MSLVYADGFDHWGSFANMLAGGWFQQGDGCNISTQHPRTGGWGYRNDDNYGGAHIGIILDTPLDALTVGCACDTNNAIANNRGIGINLLDNALNAFVSVGFGSNNSVVIWTQAGGIVAQSDPNIFSPNSYNYLTMTYVRNPGTNTADITVYRENTPIIGVVGVPGCGVPIPRVSIGTIRGPNWWAPGVTFIDDFFIDDEPTFKGPQRCRTILPNANGAAQDWTKTGVANAYDALNNVPPDPAKYLSGAVGDASSFGLNTIPTNTSYVGGVMMFAALQKSDAGSCALQIGVDSGGDIDMGSNIEPGTAFSVYRRAFPQDPADGGKAWTFGAVNAVLARIERTA